MLIMFRSRRLFCELMQQACEKIDRTREHAGEIFANLLYHRLSSSVFININSVFAKWHCIMLMRCIHILQFSV